MCNKVVLFISFCIYQTAAAMYLLYPMWQGDSTVFPMVALDLRPELHFYFDGRLHNHPRLTVVHNNIHNLYGKECVLEHPISVQSLLAQQAQFKKVCEGRKRIGPGARGNVVYILAAFAQLNAYLQGNVLVVDLQDGCFTMHPMTKVPAAQEFLGQRDFTERVASICSHFVGVPFKR